jgi:RHS repeat-associated protein
MASGNAPATHVVEFLWDGDALAAEYDSEHGVRVHVHEPETLVPMLQAEQDEVFAVLCDHVGTPKELVGQDGKVAWSAAHSAWGRIEEVEGRTRPVESPFRLLGQYADGETGLCCTRYRYFEAATGRWLSPDPIGLFGGRNLFAFDGAPTNEVDPLGLACKPPYAPAFDDPTVARVIHHKDGSVTYCFKAGFRVKYDANGHPDFDPHAVRRGGKPVKYKLTYTGSRGADFRGADKAKGITAQERWDNGWTWHHESDVRRTSNGSYVGTMTLVPRDVHEAAKHSGGVSIYQKRTGTTYGS